MHLFVLFCLICKSERSRIPNSREIDSFRDRVFWLEPLGIHLLIAVMLLDSLWQA